MHNPPVPQDTPDRKPKSVTFLQVAVFVIALCSTALYFLLMQRLVGMIGTAESWRGLDVGVDPDSTPMDLATGEYLWAFAFVLGLPVVLLILALLSAIGMQKRKRWARILTAVWIGIFLLPFAAWAAGAVLIRMASGVPTGTKDYFIGPIDPLTLNAIAGPFLFVCALVVFILALKRGARQWAPKKSATGFAGQAPGAPAPFGAPQGFAPQQMPQQAPPGQFQQSPQQTPPGQFPQAPQQQGQFTPPQQQAPGQFGQQQQPPFPPQ
ncbi:hypothetical protein [Glycomyces buryatensis]|uniref:hypothetical protein n=1 Tax=Glycomyces buryatensis TaxID=2570927 RepID=UPI001B3C1549|nr:hypothetical protein [Glycomyces buryatensis]